ncbi:MAG: isopeptide-forming domain-containing fimbrial protein [Turicibacter sp.]|nr:isopeptide-forming domain-containing fimbrial protein [Turicibacter sp.]
MATISGRLMYDANRTGTTTANYPGIAGVPVVLQNTATGATLAVLTDSNGNYSFTNVPAGNYQIVEQGSYSPTTATPGNFANAANATLLDGGTFPPISAAGSLAPSGATNLDSTSPNTLKVTVSANQNPANQNILNGPVTYAPLTLAGSSVEVIGPNLITDAADGTFGSNAPGTAAGTTVNPNPYPNLNSSFTYVSQQKPNDGYITVSNVKHLNDNTWWNLADHTTGNETGRMLVINGGNPGQNIMSVTVPVDPNSNYLFSAWFANLIKQTGFADPAFGIKITDSTGNVLQQLSLGGQYPANTSNPVWKQAGVAFNSGNNTSLTLSFVSLGPAANGNDYVMDDVALQKVDVVQPTVPPMMLNKTSNQSEVPVGQPVTYTVTLTNPTQTPMSNVQFQDSLSQLGLTFLPGTVTIGGTANSSADPNAGFTVPDIPIDGSTTVSFQAVANSVPPVNPIPNTANTTYNYSPVVGLPGVSRTSTSNTSLLSILPLQITKAAPASTSPGGVVTYTLTVTNPGNSVVSGASVSDSLQNGQTYMGGSASVNVGGAISTPAVSGTASTPAFSLPDIPANSTVTLTFQAQVPQGAAANSTLTNNASMTYTPPGGTASATVPTNTTSTTVQLSPAALKGTKVASQASAIPGQPVSYMLTVTNTGQQPTTAFNVADVLPAGLTYAANSAVASINGNPSVLTVGGSGSAPTFMTADQLAPGQTATITFNANLDPSLPSGTNLVNTAALKTNTADPGTAVSDPGVTVLPTNINNDAFSKTSSPSNILAGAPIAYALNYQNQMAGNAPLTVNDALPGGVAMSGTTAQLVVNGTATTVTNTGTASNPVFTIPSPIPANSSVSIQFSANTDPTLAAGTVLKNAASITNGSQVLNANDPGVTVSVPNLGDALKTASPATVKPGDVVTFTVTGTNTGSVDANPLTLTENPLPNGLALVAGSSTAAINGSSAPVAEGGSSTAPVFTVGAPVPPGQSVTVTFQATVPAGLSDGTQITNSVLLQTNPGDPGTTLTANPVSVAIPQFADATKTPLSSLNVEAGGTVAFNISGTNNGSGKALPFTIADSLPNGLNISDAPGTLVSGTVNGAAANFLVGGTSTSPTYTLVDANSNPIPLNQGASYSVTVHGNVPQGLADGTEIDNTANISGYPGSPLTPVNAIPLKIGTPFFSNTSKTPSISNISPGDTFSYTVTGANNSNNPVTPVVTDALPAGLSFASDANHPVTSTPSDVGIDAANPLKPVFTFAAPVDPGQSFSVTFFVKADTNLVPPASLVNTVNIASNTGDPTEQQNAAAEPVLVGRPNFFTVTKGASVAKAAPGDPISYTINGTNTGAQNAVSFTANDTLPAGQTISGPVTATITEADGTVRQANVVVNGTAPNVSFTITDPDGSGISPDETLAINYTVDNSGTAANTPLTNTVITTSTDKNNNTFQGPPVASATVTTIGTPLGPVTKSSSPSSILPGDIITYTVSVTNQSPLPAASISATDSLPGGLVLVAGTPQATVNKTPTKVTANGTSDLSFTIPGPIPPGGEATLTFQAQVPKDAANGTMYQNSISMTTPDSVAPVTGQDPGVTVQAPSFSDAAKSTSPTILAGSNQDYSVSATNTGAVSAPYLQFNDLFATGHLLADSPAPTATITDSSGTPQTAPVTLTGTGTNMILTVSQPIPVGATVTLNYTVTNSSPAGTVLTNTAGVTGFTADPGVNVSANSKVVAPAVTLSTTAPAVIAPGDTGTYTATVTNTGTTVVQNPAISVALPTAVSYVDNSATATAAPVPQSGQTPPAPTAIPVTVDASNAAAPNFTLNGTTLAPGESATVTYQGVVSTSTTAPSLPGTASVNADTVDPGSQLSSDSSAFSTKVVGLGLVNSTISKTASPASVNPGAAINYTLTLKHLNLIDQDLILTDNLLPNTNFPVGATAMLTINGVSSAIPNTGSSDMARFVIPQPITADADVTLQFSPTVDSDAATGLTINNSAMISDGTVAVTSNTTAVVVSPDAPPTPTPTPPLPTPAPPMPTPIPTPIPTPPIPAPTPTPPSLPILKASYLDCADVTGRAPLPLKIQSNTTGVKRNCCNVCGGKGEKCWQKPLMLEANHTYEINYYLRVCSQSSKKVSFGFSLDGKTYCDSVRCAKLKSNIEQLITATITITTGDCPQELQLLSLNPRQQVYLSQIFLQIREL